MDVGMKRRPRSGSLGNISSVEHVMKKNSKISTIKEYLIDYSLNSSLHGVRYMGERQRTIVEKLFWMLIFTVSIVICCNRIAKIWTKWDQNPIIVSFAEDFTHIWKIPYPAVTVCGAKKFNYSTFNVSENNELYEDINMLCSFPLTEGTRETSQGNTTIENLRRISSKYLTICSWNNVVYDSCDQLFHEVVTEEGICYTFNSLGAEELLRIENINTDYDYLKLRNSNTSWTLDGGYLPHTPLKTYPHRARNYRFGDSGLNLILTADKTWNDFDYKCRNPVQNYEIFLHNPAELPNLSRISYKASLSKQAVLVVRPKVMTTSEGLRQYSAERRKCYFQDQRYLRFFKVYTQSNCEMECISNYTMAICGCVHFGFPHGPEMPICSIQKWLCMFQARENLVVEVMRAIEVNVRNATVASEVAAQCKCLPACTTIEYEAELMESDFNWTALYTSFGLDIGDASKVSQSNLYVSFKDSQFITSQRSELYGVTEFLANCGGLLGLFVGFSILSVAEIFYFLTLRLCVWKKRLTNIRTENEKA